MRTALLPLLLATLLLADEPAAEHPSAELFRKGVELQRRKQWLAAKRTFRKLIEQYPDSPYLEAAEARSGDNAYLGTTVLWKSGPPERRIDVAVMGDGFTIRPSDQAKQEKWARSCIDVLWNEPAYSEYRNYFNIYFVRLASLEEGVDPQLSPEQRRKIEERNKRRARKKKTDFSTALDAKAAGPQGQVMMNPALVYRWLDIANEDVPGCGDDRYVIAFAQFGRLGMGGGGIANVGRPDKSVTTHEFGHAFARLLDEYAINPNPPPESWNGRALAANAYAKPTQPAPDEVPWAHMLAHHVKGVGIYEGGATFKQGVWRPARTCAMNAAGATTYCPVCREATILVIYEHVSPIDTLDPPAGTTLKLTAGEAKQIVVTPMQPRLHKLEAAWYVKPLAPVTPSRSDDGGWGGEGGVETEAPPAVPESAIPRAYAGFGGRRARENREAYAEPPEGEPSKLGRVLRGTVRRFAFEAGKLKPGRYRVTVEVRDPTPWVLKDEHHLLRERASWTVSVKPEE